MKLVDLPAEKYEVVRPLFSGLPFLVVDSVLAELTPATITVDDDVVPQTAVIQFGHKVIIGGEANEQSIAAVRHLLHSANLPWFFLAGTPEWQPHLSHILPEQEQWAVPRLYYRLDTRQQEWQTAVPDDMQLRPVDAALLANPTLTNLDWVREEMVSERPSIADFLEKSFGYCVIHGTEIIAWCMSEYNCGQRCELGIATAEAWQRKGLARLTATAVIQKALQQNIYEIGWSCQAENKASVRTAEALGFTCIYADTAYFLRKQTAL